MQGEEDRSCCVILSSPRPRRARPPAADGDAAQRSCSPGVNEEAMRTLNQSHRAVKPQGAEGVQHRTKHRRKRSQMLPFQKMYKLRETMTRHYHHCQMVNKGSVLT